MVGDYSSAAKNYVIAGTGGSFDGKGNFKESNNWERAGALGSAIYSTGELSGATGAIGEYMTDKAVTGIAKFEGSSNPYIKQAASKIGDGVSAGESVYNSYNNAVENSKVLGGFDQLNQAVEPVKVLNTLTTTESE
jgi:hypothetical protein